MDHLIRTIPGMLEAIKGSEEVRNAFVVAAWNRLAGTQITERTEAVGLDGKRLVIAVETKTWQRNLKDLSGQLIFDLNRMLGKNVVDFIEFRVDPSAIKRTQVKDLHEVNFDRIDQLPGEITRSAGVIRDENLRKTVLAAAANCLSRPDPSPDQSSGSIH